MSKAPFLPIRDLVIFPNVVTPIYVGRANSIATLEKAIANKTKLVLGLQKDASQENPTFDGDIYEVGVIANIVQIIRMPNNNIKVLVEAENLAPSNISKISSSLIFFSVNLLCERVCLIFSIIILLPPCVKILFSLKFLIRHL